MNTEIDSEGNYTGEPILTPAFKRAPQFGMSGGRPTLIFGDHRSTEEKLKCAQVQIECDRQLIANLKAHADKLAEALRDVTNRAIIVNDIAQEPKKVPSDKCAELYTAISKAFGVLRACESEAAQ